MKEQDYYKLPKDLSELTELVTTASEKEYSIYKEYKHFVNTEDIDGVVITPSRLMKWAMDKNRELICIFCDKEPITTNSFTYCKICNEYKGIMPNCPL